MENDFKNFIDIMQPMVNKDVGYMFILLDRDHYAPGDIVKGSVFFEMFRIGYQTKLIVQFEGSELLPKRLQSQIYQSMNNNEEGDNQGYNREADGQSRNRHAQFRKGSSFQPVEE